MSVKSHAISGLTPSDFVTHVIKEFGEEVGPSSSTEDCSRISIAWKDIGAAVSHVFGIPAGCCTMFGPIVDTKLKLRKVYNRRKRVRTTELARPEELNRGSREERTDTDKNMLTMFNILRKNRVVQLENLILNRNSFAQSVENLFALAFLVKDGRAEMKVNEAGQQLVSPRNAPSAKAVFRFDFNDWKVLRTQRTIPGVLSADHY